jgi:hypothetical protein
MDGGKDGELELKLLPRARLGLKSYLLLTLGKSPFWLLIACEQKERLVTVAEQ